MIDIDSDTESDTESDTVDEQDEKALEDVYHDRNLLACAHSPSRRAHRRVEAGAGRRRRGQSSGSRRRWDRPRGMCRSTSPSRSGRCNETATTAATRANRRTTCWRRGPKRVSVLMSRSDDISTAGPDHDVFRFECSRRDCSTIFAGDELASIAKRGARHLNREHGDSFHTTEQFDTIERGGHQVHGNEWAVTRIPQYVTAFDVLERIGAVDGLLVPARTTTRRARSVSASSTMTARGSTSTRRSGSIRTRPPDGGASGASPSVRSKNRRPRERVAQRLFVRGG